VGFPIACSATTRTRLWAHRVDREAREAYLEQISAILATEAQIEATAHQQIAPSEPPAAAPERPGDGDFTTTVLIEEPEQLLAAALDAFTDGGSPEVPTVFPCEIGIKKARSPQIAVQEEQSIAPLDTPTAAPVASDDGGLMTIWEGLKLNTGKWAVMHVEHDCAVDRYPNKPGCRSSRKAGRERRQGFFEQAAEAPSLAV
jgi:hypothetical protein